MVIGFIGLGNMASAMVRGIAAAQLEGVTLCGHNPHPEKAKELAEQCGLRLLPSNQAVLDASDVVVLAVKPQILEGVLAELAPPSGRLFISVAAGKELAWLEARLGQAAIIRVMPNINAVVGASVTGWCANDAVSDEQKALAATLLGTFGTAVEVPENSWASSAPSAAPPLPTPICTSTLWQRRRCRPVCPRVWRWRSPPPWRRAAAAWCVYPASTRGR